MATEVLWRRFSNGMLARAHRKRSWGEVCVLMDGHRYDVNFSVFLRAVRVLKSTPLETVVTKLIKHDQDYWNYDDYGFASACFKGDHTLYMAMAFGEGFSELMNDEEKIKTSLELLIGERARPDWVRDPVLRLLPE